MKATNQSPLFHRNHPSIALRRLSFHRRFWLNFQPSLTDSVSRGVFLRPAVHFGHHVLGGPNGALVGHGGDDLRRCSVQINFRGPGPFGIAARRRDGGKFILAVERLGFCPPQHSLFGQRPGRCLVGAGVWGRGLGEFDQRGPVRAVAVLFLAGLAQSCEALADTLTVPSCTLRDVLALSATDPGVHSP